MTKGLKQKLLLTFLWIYLIGCGLVLCRGTLSVIPPLNHSYSALLHESSRKIISSALYGRREAAKKKHVEYDAKLQELKDVLEEIKNLHSGRMSIFDISIVITGLLTSLFYVLAAISVFYRSSRSRSFLNLGNIGFLFFYVLVSMFFIMEIMPKFNKSFAIIEDLMMISNPQEIASASEGFVAMHAFMAGGISLVVSAIFYIFIPRYLMSRPMIRGLL